MKFYFKKTVLLAAIIFGGVFLNVSAQKQMEKLNRGLIAVKKGEGYYLTWRLLGDEAWDTGFNVYRGSAKLNDEPITNVTSYLDENAPMNSVYYVKAIIDGVEQVDKRPARIINNREGTAGWFDIPIKRPSQGAEGGNYYPNDASVGDLLGDGEYDIVLKWDPNNSKDNSQGGITDNVLLDGYTLDGDHLWRIDLGPNVRAGAHYTQFLVYDFDGDGRAEIMVKTAPGTKDGKGDFINKGPAASANHQMIYRNEHGWVLSGPEYLTVFAGATGEELATADYWPERGSVSSWGDNYGNRVDRFNAAVAYVDGERPSGVFQRGYYTRMAFAAWDWRDGELTRKWTFDSRTNGNGAYFGQGNHSLHVIDADGDGKHDLVTGAAVISGDGTGMHTSGMGHGDATHITYMKKDDPRPMIYMPHESGGHGVSLRYADDGEIIFNHRLPNADVGRGAAAEIDIEKPGFHFWASNGLGLYDITGARVGNIPNSVNFLIWWDGDLSRELLNSNRIDKWSIAYNRSANLLTGNGTSSSNGTKSTPTLSADLFGDWREEVILRRDDSNALRVYTTSIPTDHKLYTFMHDPIYRVAISWQNSSYNQPPHPGFYMASDMDFPVAAPDISIIDNVNRGSGFVVKDLQLYDISNAMDWKVMNKLTTDQAIFGDMNFFYDEGPEYLTHKEWIRTSMESRKTLDPVLAKFEVKKDAEIYIIHQKSITDKPEWLNEWTLSEEPVYIRNASGARVPMDLYLKSVTAGESVSVGTNSNDGSATKLMYFIVTDAGVVNTIHVTAQENVSLDVYPNPFSETTKVQFDLVDGQYISLDVFDLNGRLIKNLGSGWQNAGAHEALFNAAGLPSGIYFIRLTANDTFLHKKIILNR